MFHDVNWYDLDFERFPLPFRSTSGVPQTRWVRFGMPRIPPEVIRSVFFLYKDREDAEAGRNPGGTGFIVRYDGVYGNPRRSGASQRPGASQYGVTNWHVACRGGHSVIRLNKNNGGTDVIEFGPEDWHFLPGKYDVAVVPLDLSETHDVSVISTDIFAPMADGRYRREIGVGEDVFMMGLFFDHGGTTTNVPAARFGNISMMPNPKATIEQPTGFPGESFVVDMHSRTGFSGSPVFVYRTFGADLTSRDAEFDNLIITNIDSALRGAQRSGHLASLRGRIGSNSLFHFLGIHWGQFPEQWELRDDKSLIAEARRDLIVKGGYVEGMSGMTCVIPAWNVLEVLDMPSLSKIRQSKAAARAAQRASASVPKAESAPPASDANPTHREDFNSLVSAAARKREQED